MRDHSIGTIQKVDRLLDQLLDLEPSARERQLKSIRARNDVLARELERLLALCLEEFEGLIPGGALSGEVARECLLGLEEATELPPGTQIGPYRIEDLIGKGGMSEVYRAVRRFDGFFHSVALKLVRSDRISADLRERLLSEQRTLVRLDHPNIARFLDAGIGPDGNAYLAMELVEGAPVAEYANAVKADLRTRLLWMIDLCKALAHAHAQLIVHCDIKPSNVLMDREGRVRLLDFGIARAIQETAESPYTGGDFNPFTPDYAAPEQVTGSAVTTATDVFQVGALLYRLIVGRRWLRQNSQALAVDLDATIHEVPLAMSDRLLIERSDPDIQANAKACGRTSVAALARDVSGDLDAIVLRCLEKSPERRYASILLLAQDIQAYLDGRPVSARPSRVSYQVRKWIGRHQAVTALTSILLISALSFTIVLGVQALRLAEARDHAQQEALVANTVLDYMLTMFRAVDPESAQGKEVSAREMLDLGSEALQDRFTDQPAQRERVLRVLGEAYESIGRYKQAELHFIEARSLADQLTGSSQRRARLETESLLARIDIRQRRVGEAKTRLEAILTEAVGKDDGDSRLRLNALSNLAGIYAIIGPREEAVALSRRALTERRRVDGPAHPNTMKAMSNHAAILSASGERRELEEARALMAEVLRHAGPILGESSPTTLNYQAHYFTLSSMLLGDLNSARSLRTTLARLKEVLGEHHPDVLVTWRNYALALDRAGESAQARTELEGMVQQATEVLPPTHSGLGFALLRLAEIQVRAGEDDRAARNLVRALSTTINLESARESADLHPLLLRPDVQRALRSSEASESKASP